VKNGYDAIELKTNTVVMTSLLWINQISGGLYGENTYPQNQGRRSDPCQFWNNQNDHQQTDLGFANKLLESGAYWYGYKIPG
jgi:hypothetical protein